MNRTAEAEPQRFTRRVFLTERVKTALKAGLIIATSGAILANLEYGINKTIQEEKAKKAR